MGEYFNYHKLGTCDHLMYITRQEVEKFAAESTELNQSKGNLPYLKYYLDLKRNWMYRFPRSSEAAVKLSDIDGRTAESAYLEIEMPAGFEVIHNDRAQITIKSAYGGRDMTFNANFCPMDPKHFDKMAPTQACGWGEEPGKLFNPIIEAVGVRYTQTHPDGYTVFRCPFCDQWFSCDEEECDNIIKTILHERGLWFEEKQIKPYYEERDKN